MSNQPNPQSNANEPMIYQIRIKGHLGPQWTDWFGGVSITLEANGDTLLTCSVIDQAALHGVLRAVRDLGLPLISVIRANPPTGSAPDTRSQSETSKEKESRLMKAIVYTEYGSPDVVQFEEVEKPTPKDDEVLIKVHAASINAGDLHYLRGTPWLFRLSAGLPRPKNTLLGADVAGRIEAVGRNVTQFQPGDEVFGDLSAAGRGTFAEYVCANESTLVLKPTHVSFEVAAATPLAAVTALQGLRKGQIQAGQKVLVNGASGGVGSFAVQIAKSLGAEVTAVCSTQKIDMVRSLGADHVVDYTQSDVTRSGEHYDLILDAAAFRSFSEYKRVLSPTGIYVLGGGSTGSYFQTMLLGPVMSRSEGQTFTALTAGPNQADLGVIKDLLETGKVTPAIDRRFPLSETAAALRYVEERQVQGKVVITVAQ